MDQPEPLPDTTQKTGTPSRSMGTDPEANLGVWRADELRWLMLHEDELEDSQLDQIDVEPPCRDNQLAAYEAMLLNNLMIQQMHADRFGTPYQDLGQTGQSRPLYDWFVSALNVAPLCDAMLGFIERLAIWKRSTKRSASRRPDQQPLLSDPMPAWPEPRELQV